MTTMTRMLQRGLVLLALVALLAASCGDDDTTADGKAAPETTPPATVEETTTDTVTTDTAPPATVEPTPPTTADRQTQEELDSRIQEVLDPMMPGWVRGAGWVRGDCRPWATEGNSEYPIVNPEYPIPGTVTAAAVSELPFDWGSGVMIAIEEDPGIVLLYYGGDGDIEQAPPLSSEQASTGDDRWYPVDEASADYLGLPPDSVSDGWGDETVVAMKECLASIQNWDQNWETRMTRAAEAMGWMADASLAVGDANSPAEKSATCTAVLADPEKDRAMDALDGIYPSASRYAGGEPGGELDKDRIDLSQVAAAIGRGSIRETFNLMMISCKDGHFEDTAQYERRNAAASEEVSEALEALGYPPSQRPAPWPGSD